MERLAKIFTIPQTNERFFHALLETTGERLIQCAYMDEKIFHAPSIGGWSVDKPLCFLRHDNGAGYCLCTGELALIYSQPLYAAI